MSTVALFVSYDVNGPSGSGFDMRTITFTPPVGAILYVQTTSVISYSNDVTRDVFTITGNLISTTASIEGNIISSLFDLRGGSAVLGTNYISPSIAYHIQNIDLDFGAFLHIQNSPDRLSYVMSGNDTITGTQYNDILFGGAGNDIINGGDGIDTVIFSSADTNYSIAKNSNNFIVNTLTGTDGIDSLTNIERLKFSDENIAFDLDGNAGTTAKILGAVFGKESVSNKQYVGIGLNYLDNGMSYSDLMKLAIDARLGVEASNTDVVNLLYTNVVGSAPGKGDLDYFTGLLDSHIYTVASLGVMAADTSINTAHINLVGLATTGIEYVL